MPFPDLISTTRKLVSLSRSGSIIAARNLFDQIPHKYTIAWNAMLIAYSHSNSPLQALSLFPVMRSSVVRPNAFAFTLLFAAFADVPDLITGTKLYALVLHLGFFSSLPVCNALIDMYGKSALTDSLVAAVGIIAQEVAGDVRTIDTRADEPERGTTIKSTGISLYYEMSDESLKSFKGKRDGNEYPINLIDSIMGSDLASYKRCPS